MPGKICGPGGSKSTPRPAYAKRPRARPKPRPSGGGDALIVRRGNWKFAPVWRSSPARVYLKKRSRTATGPNKAAGTAMSALSSSNPRVFDVISRIEPCSGRPSRSARKLGSLTETLTSLNLVSALEPLKLR